MRKRTIGYLIDKIFWALVLIFPLLCYLLYCYNMTPAVNDSDYLFVDYVVNTDNTKYVNTGYIFDSNSYVDAELSFDTTGYAFGSGGSSTTMFEFAFSNAASGVGANSVSLFGITDFDKSLNVKHHYKYGQQVGVVQDGIDLYTYSNQDTWTASRGLRIWGNLNSNTDNATTKVYSFKIYSNNTLVRDYVPCISASDRVPCLIERVNGDVIRLADGFDYGVVIDSTNSGNLPSLDFVMQKTGITITRDNVVYSALDGLFGATGILPIITNSSILYYFVWFVFVELIHLAVDFLVFIPRLCHKWLACLTKDGDE